MKKIYALFSQLDGDGLRATFITTLTNPQEYYDQPIRVGSAMFLLGECEIKEEEHNDVDTRVWNVSDYRMTLHCTKFPYFEHRL